MTLSTLRSRMRLVERRNDERKCVSQTSNRFNYGIMRLLRFTRNDNLLGLESLKPLQIPLVCTTVASDEGGLEFVRGFGLGL